MKRYIQTGILLLSILMMPLIANAGWWGSLGHAISHGWNDGVHEAGHVGHIIVNTAHHAGNAIAHGAEKGFDGIKNLSSKAEEELKHLGQDAIDDVKNIQSTMARDMSFAEKWAVSQAKSGLAFSKSMAETEERLAKKFGSGLEHDAEWAWNEAKAHAKFICEKAVPFIIGQALGKRCKSTAAKFEAECNAEMDAETEGLSSPACVAGGAEILAECQTEATVTKRMIKPITNEACSHI